jgi:hypothetical protein
MNAKSVPYPSERTPTASRYLTEDLRYKGAGSKGSRHTSYHLYLMTPTIPVDSHERGKGGSAENLPTAVRVSGRDRAGSVTAQRTWVQTLTHKQ